MSIFQKLKAFLGLADVQLTDAQGAAITAEREAELANSLEFHALLEGELKDVVASQAGLIATQAKAIADSQANYEAVAKKVAELAAKIETTADNVNTLADVAQKQSENLQAKAETAKVAQVDTKIGELAKKLNAMLGKPLVESKEADAETGLATGKISDAAKVDTVDKLLAKIKGGQ
jgi:uncharacterized protein YceH (UPF0502 family)